jgi:hypothetical protein
MDAGTSTDDSRTIREILAGSSTAVGIYSIKLLQLNGINPNNSHHPTRHILPGADASLESYRPQIPAGSLKATYIYLTSAINYIVSHHHCQNNPPM